MIAARNGAVRGVRAVTAARTAPRAFSGTPPKPVEEDDKEEIEQAMEVVVRSRGTTFERTPATCPDDYRFLDNPAEALAMDPLPRAQVGRKVVISQHCRAATTSGTNGTQAWHLNIKNQERWSNPLMGWTSSADPLSNLDLSFETPEQAVFFAKKRGWDYEVKKPLKTEVVRGAFAYSHNFLPHDVERDLKINGTKTKQFVFPTAGSSHYERPLTFHGTGTVNQHGNPE